MVYYRTLYRCCYCLHSYLLNILWIASLATSIFDTVETSSSEESKRKKTRKGRRRDTAKDPLRPKRLGGREMPSWLDWLYYAAAVFVALLVVAILGTLLTKRKASSRERREPIARGWIFLMVLAGLSLILLGPYYLLGAITGNFLLGGFVGVILTIVIAIFIVPSQVLAPRNMFFTTPKEGTTKFVVRGRRWKKSLLEWRNHHLDDQGKVVEGEPARSFWNRKFGIEFYGWWPWDDILVSKFRWSGITEHNVVQHKEEFIEAMIVVDYGYLVTLEDAEDSDGLHLYIELIFTIRMTNPRRARFDVQDWLEIVLQRSREPSLEYVRSVSYQTFLKTKIGQESAGKAMLQRMEDRGLTGANGEFEKLYGAQIRAIQFRRVDPPPEYREQTLKKFTAEREAEAKIVTAKAGKEATIITAQAEAQRLQKIYKKIEKFGDIGKLMQTLDAVGKSSLAASIAVQAIPGLPEVLRDVFGKKPEEIGREDIKAMREEIKKIAKDVESLKKPKAGD